MKVLRLRTVVFVGMVVAGLGAPAGAAPIGADDPRGDSQRQSGGALDARSEPDAAPALPTSGHKTIDLLLQIQSESVAASAPSATAKAATSLPPTPPKADPTPLDQLKELMMSIGGQPSLRAPMEASATAGRLEHQRQEPSFAGPSVLAPRPLQAATLPAGRSLLDHPAVRFIRENRLMVIAASLAVLAAVWGAANFSLRRPRH